MGSTKTDSDTCAGKIQTVRDVFAEAMRRHGFAPANPFLVAFSGGLDSSVLLDLVTRYSDQPQELVRVIHVHHGLHADADQWLRHCRETSQSLGLAFHAGQIELEASAGNLEAEARRQRYGVMLAHLRDHETLLLAHHRGDTAETFFLNLMRGAGARGLSGIPVLAHRGGKHFFRPMQALSRSQIREYATRNHLRWMEDDSNTDLRFDRNFLRHRVLPLLKERWPQSEKMVSRACRNLAESAALAEEVGAADLQAAAIEDYRPGSIHQLQIPLPALMQLAPLRRKNLLRHAFSQLVAYAPDRRFLHKLLALVQTGVNNKQLRWEKWTIHVYDGQLFFYQANRIVPAPDDRCWNLETQQSMCWGATRLSVEQPARAEVEIRARRGGEKLQLSGRAHGHSLKALLQGWRVPPWERTTLPLIWRGEKLVAVPGYLQPSDIAEAGDLQGVRFHLRNRQPQTR